MAFVIPGRSRCSLCGMTIQANEEVVAFLPFATDDSRLAVLSDAGVHLPCLEQLPDQDRIQDLFLQQAGPDGQRRSNGTTGLTLSKHLRLVLGQGDLTLWCGRLYLVIRAPLETCRDWHDSDYWQRSSHRHYVGRGLSADADIEGEWIKLEFRSSPYGMTPLEAEPWLVEEVRRATSLAEGEEFFAEIRHALHQGLRLRSGV